MNSIFGEYTSIFILLLIIIGIAYIITTPICVAVIANKQGRSGFFWFFLSILLNPFFSIIILIALGDTDEKRKQKVIEDEKARLSICDSLKGENRTNQTPAEPDYSRFMPH